MATAAMLAAAVLMRSSQGTEAHLHELVNDAVTFIDRYVTIVPK